MSIIKRIRHRVAERCVQIALRMVPGIQIAANLDLQGSLHLRPGPVLVIGCVFGVSNREKLLAEHPELKPWLIA